MTLAATGDAFSADLSPYIILFPLIGSVLLLLAGKRLGSWAGVLASSAVGLSFIAGVIQFFRMLGVSDGHARSATYHWFEWVAAGGFRADADLLVDQLSMVMVLVVTGVGTLIHVYSIGYMAGDPRYPRYFAFLNLFAASMLLLVLGDNLLLMFVGWEGVGLCSYLLIGFWFEKDSAANAAKKAFIVNRIGDFSFMLGIFLLAFTVQSLVFEDINAAARGGMSAGTATIAALLLFGGATGKSAQIPLYIWLPDAMEGPSPVSALIHAATMVTAGVYMVARVSPLFDASGDALTVVAWIGAATALWAALMAAAEYDIKKILAYSTISQLGYMFLAHGVGAYSAGIFHLVTHAFFKALMFLGAGAVMHALAGETDIRKMGGLGKVMPITGTTFAAGWLAICGIFPFAGFFSKDAILASAWAQGEYVLWAMGVGTALLTAFYMSRLYFKVFEGPVVLPEGVHVHEADKTMLAALVPLGALSLAGGLINLPGLLTLEHFVEPVVGESELPSGLAPWMLGGAALLVAVLGILAARSLYLLPGADERRSRLQRPLAPLVSGARNKFYIDEIYGKTIVLPGKSLATFCAEVIDLKIIDGAVNGTAWVIGRVSSGARRIQTGYVRNYAAVFLIGVVVVFSVLVLRAGTGR